MNPRKTVCFLTVLFIACAPLALAQGTYTQIDYPGAIATVCSGINSAGDVTGSYEFIDNLWHGFLLSKGVYTTIEYPGATQTYLFGINDLGQIVGDATGSVGFLYDVQTQTFTQISYPGATFTEPTSINNAGTIAGSFDSNGWQGFELIGTNYIAVAPPAGETDAHVLGITSSGELLVDVNNYPSGNITSYLFNHGTYKQLTTPSPFRYVLGINSKGSVFVGEYGTIGSRAVAFVRQNGTFQILSFPKAINTVAEAINDAGEVVGSFNQKANLHGFTWTP